MQDKFRHIINALVRLNILSLALNFSDSDNTGQIRLCNDVVRYIGKNISLFIDFYQNATTQDKQALEKH